MLRYTLGLFAAFALICIHTTAARAQLFDTTSNVQKLQSPDPDKRRSGAISAGVSKNLNAVNPLIAVLSDDDWMVREYAAESLGQIGDRSAVPALIDAMKNNRDRRVRSRAAAALGAIKDFRALEPLIWGLANKDEHWDVRRMAAKSLGKLKHPAAVDPLISAFTDSQPMLRQSIVEALKDNADPKAVDVIITALRDPETSVVNEALLALRDKREKRAGKPVFHLIRNRAVPAQSRALAASMIVDIAGGSQSTDMASEIAALAIALADPKEEVRTGAQRGLEAVSRIGFNNIEVADPEAEAALDALIKGKDTALRLLAIRVISALKGEKATLLLLDLLRDGDADVQESALFGLAARKEPRAVAAAISFLQNKDERMRNVAVRLLAQTGGPQAVAALKAHVQRESDERTRMRLVMLVVSVGERNVTEVLNTVAKNDASMQIRGIAKAALENIQ